VLGAAQTGCVSIPARRALTSAHPCFPVLEAAQTGCVSIPAHRSLTGPRPCSLVLGAAHTRCVSLPAAWSSLHTPAWCTELPSPRTGAEMVGMLPAGSFHQQEQQKQQVSGAGEASRVVEAASTPPGCGHHPADGERSRGRGGQDPAKRSSRWDLGTGKGSHQNATSNRTHLPVPRATPPPRVPSRFPGLPPSLPAAVTSRNIFGSSCRRRGDAWPSPRSRPRNAVQTSPPTPGISDVPARRRYGTATAARPPWGHGRASPPTPSPPAGTLHSQVLTCRGFRVGFRSSPWGATGDDVLLSVPSGDGSGGGRTGQQQLPHPSAPARPVWFHWWVGRAMGWGCWCPRSVVSPWGLVSPPRLSPPQPQVPVSVPQFPHDEVRDNDVGVKSSWRTAVFWLLVISPGLTWDGGVSTERCWWVSGSPVHWLLV